MAAAPVHLLMGAVVGLAAESTTGIPAVIAGHILAVISHVWLDDLNVGEMRWYHGYGSGWLRIGYVAFTIITTIILSWVLFHSNKNLLSYAVVATWADWEHPVRWILKTDRFWLHRHIIAWEGWRRPVPGIAAWVVTTTALLLVLLPR